jgi:hypothetical protein
MALVTDLRDDLLALIRSTTSNAAALVRILSDINAAVQRIYELGPDFWSVTSGGAQVRAPASITGLTLVNGETSISGTGLATWMHGCTVQLSGEAQQNEIRVTSAIPAYALANPYQGTGTSSATGTVYHDAINLAASVTKIEPPVFLAGKWELYPADDPRDQYSPNYYSTDHGRRRHHAGFLWETEKNVGTPEVYTVERNLTYANEITARIRLAPLPDTTYSLKYRQRHAAYRVTSLADTVTSLVPHGYNETLLMPIARYLFSGWVDFALLSDGADRKRIEEDYATAMQLLRSLSQKQERHTIAASGRNC